MSKIMKTETPKIQKNYIAQEQIQSEKRIEKNIKIEITPV